MSVQQPTQTEPPKTEPPKPGRTRVAFIAVGAIIAIFGFLLCLFAWRADTATTEKLAFLVAGSLISTIGAVIGYLFGTER